MKLTLESMIFFLDMLVRLILGLMALVALLAFAVNVPLGH